MFFSGSLIDSAGSWRFPVSFPGHLSGFIGSWKFSELFLVTCFLEILHWFFLVPNVVMLVPEGFSVFFPGYLFGFAGSWRAQWVILVSCLVLLAP